MAKRENYYIAIDEYASGKTTGSAGDWKALSQGTAMRE